MAAAGDVLSGSGTLKTVVGAGGLRRAAGERAGGCRPQPPQGRLGRRQRRGGRGDGPADEAHRRQARDPQRGDRRQFPGPSSRPERAQEPGAAAGDGGQGQARHRHRVRWRRRPHRRHRFQGPHPVRRPVAVDPGARRAEGQAGQHHHRRREGEPGAVRRSARDRRQAADVEDRPFADQGQDGGDRLAAGGRDERPCVFRRPLLRLRRCALCRRAAAEGGGAQWRRPGRAARSAAEPGQHAGAALPLRRRPQVRGGLGSARPAEEGRRGRSTTSTACGSTPRTAGGCCAPRTPRPCWSPAPKRATKRGWSG